MKTQTDIALTERGNIAAQLYVWPSHAEIGGDGVLIQTGGFMKSLISMVVGTASALLSADRDL